MKGWIKYHTHMEYYSAIKKDEILSLVNTGKSGGCYVKGNELGTEGQILHDCIHV